MDTGSKAGRIMILLLFAGVTLSAGFGASYGAVAIGITGGAAAGLLVSVIVNAIRGQLRYLFIATAPTLESGGERDGNRRRSIAAMPDESGASARNDPWRRLGPIGHVLTMSGSGLQEDRWR